jgi:S-adenosylmethionine:tRNA ribosyltransferase-isomerase
LEFSPLIALTMNIKHLILPFFLLASLSLFSQETADKINSAKKDGRRVVVVGTTAMRTLESCSENNTILAGSKETSIFITPGYKFQIADVLITNFHLPKSTLFMLVCAFAGYEEMKNIYKYAIDNKMRFFSYGDAMMIEKKDK